MRTRTKTQAGLPPSRFALRTGRKCPISPHTGHPTWRNWRPRAELIRDRILSMLWSTSISLIEPAVKFRVIAHPGVADICSGVFTPQSAERQALAVGLCGAGKGAECGIGFGAPLTLVTLRKVTLGRRCRSETLLVYGTSLLVMNANRYARFAARNGCHYPVEPAIQVGKIVPQRDVLQRVPPSRWRWDGDGAKQ